jgi:hypothetical protein
MCNKLLGIINVRFEVTDQLLIKYFAFLIHWRKNGSPVRQYINYSWASREPIIQFGGSIVQCSRRAWGAREINSVD